MPKIVSFLVFFVFTHTAVFSQTREELEKQRVELKKEIEQTEKLLIFIPFKKMLISTTDCWIP